MPRGQRAAQQGVAHKREQTFANLTFLFPHQAAIIPPQPVILEARFDELDAWSRACRTNSGSPAVGHPEKNVDMAARNW
jgi:hypothetical protein